jgi:hypothetical protein
MKWLKSSLEIMIASSKLFFYSTLLSKSPAPLDFTFNPNVAHVGFLGEFNLDLALQQITPYST